MLNGDTPLFIIRLIEPSQALAQLTLYPPSNSNAVLPTSNAGGAIKVMVYVVVQPLASVTVKVYVPAHSAVISSSIETKLLGPIQL